VILLLHQDGSNLFRHGVFLESFTLLYARPVVLDGLIFIIEVEAQHIFRFFRGLHGFGDDARHAAKIVNLVRKDKSVLQFFRGVLLQLARNAHIRSPLEHLRVNDVSDDRLILSLQISVQEFNQFFASYIRVVFGFMCHFYASCQVQESAALIVARAFATIDRMANPEQWPALPLAEWQDSYRTLHMWTQIAGKIRMVMSPPLNHWWHVSLYVNSLGLTTGPVPYPGGVFEIQFNFQEHELTISTSEGAVVSRPLRAESVASFYRGIFDVLKSLGIDVAIDLRPQEIADATPFDRDFANCSYDGEYAQRFWRILVSSGKVFQRFRARFIGKCSPVHFYWGSFDLACTRFSGRLAPPRKGVISGPAYSHEVWSAGFWPGGGAVDGPAFYAYAVPKPASLETEPIRPAAANWNPQLSEFILMYDDVRRAESPEQSLYDFLESTYDASARRANWDRLTLEAT